MGRSRVILGAEYYPDTRSSRAISLGDVYIGDPDTDPEILANRKTVYLIQENGTEVPIAPASQPLSLGAGGVIMYSGSPVQVQTDDNYSIKVLDSQGVQIYYFNSINNPVDIVVDVLQSANFYPNDPSSASNAYVIVPPSTPLPDALIDNMIAVLRPSDNGSGNATISVKLSGGFSAPLPWLLPDKTSNLPADYVKTSRDYMVRYDEALLSWIDVDMGLFSYNPSIQIWNNKVDYYTIPSYVSGSNDALYKSTAQNGPNLGGAINPVGDVSGTWVMVQNSADPATNDFRLTLATNTPVTITDTTSTSVYLTPYIGNKMSVYNGAAWEVLESTQLTLSIGTVTAGIGFDVFAYSNSGVLAIEKLAWTDANNRATALAYQNGVLVKSGDATRRYIGSFLSSTTTQTTDRKGARYLYNYYNRVSRETGRILSNFATDTYTTATWRAFSSGSVAYSAIDSGAACPRFFVGVVEDGININCFVTSSNSSAGVQRTSAYGLNITTAPTGPTATCSGNTNVVSTATCGGSEIPVLGYNYVAVLQYSEATGTTTWWGSSGVYTSGCYTVVRC